MTFARRVKINGTKVDTYLYPADMKQPQWHAWTFDLPAGLANVENMTIGIEGGEGIIYVDTIRLYPLASEMIDPIVPDNTELLASYPFEGNYQDASGNGLHGSAVGAAAVVSDAQRGSVLSLDGIGSCVDLGADSRFNFPGSFTLAAWVNITDFTVNWGHNIMSKRGENNVGWQIRRYESSSNLTFTVRGTDGDDMPRGTTDMSAYFNEWVQITAVYDLAAGMRSMYVNGLLDVAVKDGGVVAAATHNVYIGARAVGANTGPERFFRGMVDDVRIYNRALSQAEVLGLTGSTDPIYKPF